MKVLWSLNCTLQPAIGRTTETKVFQRRCDALDYASVEGARGYLLRMADPGSGLAPIPAGNTTLNKWIGDFSPSASEAAAIERLLGQPLPQAA